MSSAVSQPTSIDWEALEGAVERNAPDVESFLERSSGAVVTIAKHDPEAPHLRTRISNNIKDFVRIDPASSREQYRWMERFVNSVVEEALRDRLRISIDGKGAFRRFKDVLLAYPAERERWFSYRAGLLHWHMHNWLKEHEIEPIETPPWGIAEPPPELPVVVPESLQPPAEPPGESLRRQACELLDTIPAIELTSVIAFLEFLRDRGAAQTLKAVEPLDSSAVKPNRQATGS